MQAELQAELAIGRGSLLCRRLDVSRQQLLAQDRAAMAGEATAVPEELL